MTIFNKNYGNKIAIVRTENKNISIIKIIKITIIIVGAIFNEKYG